MCFYLFLTFGSSRSCQLRHWYYTKADVYTWPKGQTCMKWGGRWDLFSLFHFISTRWNVSCGCQKCMDLRFLFRSWVDACSFSFSPTLHDFFFPFELWILSASSGVYSTCGTCTPAYTNTHIPIHIYIYIYARWGNLISHAELPSPPLRPEKKEVRERSRPLSRPTGTLPTHTHKKEPFVLDCLFII